MKKSILFLLFFCIFIFSGIFVSVFLPKINIEITINPQYQSVANAHEVEPEEPSCFVLSSNDYDLKKFASNVNKLYDKGYRLQGFSSSSYSLGVSNSTSFMKIFAVACQE